MFFCLIRKEGVRMPHFLTLREFISFTGHSELAVVTTCDAWVSSHCLEGMIMLIACRCDCERLSLCVCPVIDEQPVKGMAAAISHFSNLVLCRLCH